MKQPLTGKDIIAWYESRPELLDAPLALDSAQLCKRADILSIDADEFKDRVVWIYASVDEAYEYRCALIEATEQIEADARKLMPSAHGHKLAKLARKYRELLRV